MQLFLFLNNLAGRWPFLDEIARFFYIGALPALGTLLLAQLLILPRSGQGVSRSKTALTLVLALGLGALLAWGFDLVAGWLHLGNLSPRPWMTRRVNWLVVEPQDNSFPCVEVVLAAAVACASWKLNFRWGIVSWATVVLFSLTRLFCGNNYFADVLVGMALGASSFVLCSQLCQRHMELGRRAREFSLSASPLAVTLVGCYFFALLSPRFQGKLGIGSPAAASSAGAVSARSTATSVTQGEGEGMEPADGAAEELALAKRSSLFLPQVEAFLRGKLTPIARPFTLLDVEAAPVKAGTTSYRCAAIRFEVPAEQPNTRHLVTERAARLVQMAFALDSQLQNVDIIAVARDEGRNLDNSLMTFAGDEVPVLTASISRQKWATGTPTAVVAKTAVVTPTTTGTPTPTPTVDGLSWLRARSRVYINEKALPNSTSAVDPTLAPALGLDSAPNSTPLPSATASRTAPALKTPTPLPSTTATPKVTPRASASPRPTSRANSAPLPKATSQAVAQRTSQPKASPRPQATARPRPTTASSARPQPTRTSTSVAAKGTPRPTPTRTATATLPRP